MFPFTFNFNVPGLPNPFSTSEPPGNGRCLRAENDSTDAPAPPYLPSAPQGGINSTRLSRGRANLPKINRPRPSPSPSPAPPVSRKRGWEPSFAEPSRSTTTLASSSGYLDTPAKYREMAMAADWNGYQDATMNDQQDRQEDDEMPAMKKRRGLAGSIVSTALSAALIGTAVGLTVYRLWRDRGKEQAQARIEDVKDHESQPPPPYESTSAPEQWQRIEQPAAIRVTPATPRSAKKPRAVLVTAQPKRPVAYARRPRRAPGHSSPVPIQQTPRPEFDFGRDGEEDEDVPVEDKMDWIGDKLTMLIEQGKRALNAEVVVMSDAKEDEVDDGTGAWEEEDRTSSSRPHSRSGSVRRSGSSVRRPKALNLRASSPMKAATHMYASGSSSASPYISSFAPSSAPSGSSLSAGVYGQFPGSYSSTTSLNEATHEASSGWESPELKESMERARARLIAKRMGGGS